MPEEMAITPWNSNAGAIIPTNVREVTDLLPYNKRLFQGEINQLEKALSNDLYSMAIEFTWLRTVNILREKVMSFGDEFVLEMLGRTSNDAVNSITESDIVRLATDLGIINETAKMRFLQIIELIAHFSSRKVRDEEMSYPDALMSMSSCMKHVLALEDEGFQIQYNNFRDKLKEQRLHDFDETVTILELSPYFYKRTTVRTLLNLLRNSKGAEQEIVYNNMLVIIPKIWSELLSDDRYSLGVAYAESVNFSQEELTKALKAVLLKVKGFDYVPEDLRSRSFIEAANRLFSMHHSIDNFYKEPAAAKALLSMGTSIPKPALGPVMTAVITCKVGNSYGYSWDAQSALDGILDSVNEERWRHYFNSTFLADEEILYKLIMNSSKIDVRFTELVNKYKLHELNNLNNTQINRMLVTLSKSNYTRSREIASEFYYKLRGQK